MLYRARLVRGVPREEVTEMRFDWTWIVLAVVIIAAVLFFVRRRGRP